MFNLFRMDLRRLVRSKSFYIVLAVTVGFFLMMVFMFAAVADPTLLNAMEQSGVVAVEGDDHQMAEEIRAMSQLEFTHECLGSGILLVVVCIGVTLFVHSDFSSGYVKNICFARRRWEYVLAKVLTAGVYSGVLAIVSLLVVLAGPVLFGLHLTASSIADILQYVFWLWLPHWAFSLMGLGLVLLTRGSTLGIILAVVSGGGLTAAILQYYRSQFDIPPVERYLLSMVVGDQCIPWLGTSQMAMILACTAGWALLYGATSLIIMEKRDI